MIIKKFVTSIKKFLFGFNSEKRLHGTIKFFDKKKRFGFIISGQKEYFFHAESTRSEDLKRLQDKSVVTFKLINGKKGLQADDIQLNHST